MYWFLGSHDEPPHGIPMPAPPAREQWHRMYEPETVDTISGDDTDNDEFFDDVCVCNVCVAARRVCNVCSGL